MATSPDDIQQKIAQIEALRTTLGDAAVDAAIAALHAQAAPAAAPATDARQSQGFVDQPTGPVEQGFSTTQHNEGIAVGLNAGTIQQFFGTPQPGEDKQTLLHAYLERLVSEYQQVRLNRLTDRQRSGAEQGRAPQLRLQAVYTSLVVDGMVTAAREQYRVDHTRRLLHECDPGIAAPEQVRFFKAVPIDNDTHFLWQSLQESYRTDVPLDTIIADLPDDTLLDVAMSRPLLALEALQQAPRLVLLGESGGGKSTVLRYLALLLAQKALGQSVTVPGWDDERIPVPLLCPLGAVASTLAAGGDADQALWQTLGELLDGKQGIRAGLRDHLKPALRSGGVLLLFDGLDELPTSGSNPRQQVAHAVRRFAAEAPMTPIVVTSRVLAYQAEGDWKLPDEEGWQVRTIQPLAFGQVRQFVQQWYRELADQEPTLSPEEAAQRAQTFIDDLEANERLKPLVRSPLLLTMLSILHYNRNNLPQNRAQLYEECVQLLLDRWDTVRTPGMQRSGLLARLGNIPNLEIDQVRGVIHKLAVQAHSKPPGDDGRGLLDGVALEGEMLRFFRRLGCDDPAAKVEIFIQILQETAGLLEARADDQYAFPHLTFQEYLAACGLADDADMVSRAYSLWTDTDADRWREVLLLLAGRLRIQGLRTVEREGLPWLKHLLNRRIGRKEKTATQRRRDAALAALTYIEYGESNAFVNSQMDVVAEVEEPLRAALVDLLAEHEPAVPQSDRITAGLLLGELGDPRFPVSIEEWKAEAEKALNGDTTLGLYGESPYFCKVEQGTYIIGSSDDDPDAEYSEKPQHTVTFNEPFWVARLPITYEQWHAWVQKGKATYNDIANDMNHRNHPVVILDWHRCRDFCHWLSLQTGLAIRLPSEAEWEAAARGRDGRRYPWGNDWRDDHAATPEVRDGWHWKPPVGCYPAGAAPSGALDMASLCERTHTPWTKNHDPPRSTEVADDAEWFTVKGGIVHCAKRTWITDYHTMTAIYEGFRVLLSSRGFAIADSNEDT